MRPAGKINAGGLPLSDAQPAGACRGVAGAGAAGCAYGGHPLPGSLPRRAADPAGIGAMVPLRARYGQASARLRRGGHLSPTPPPPTGGARMRGRVEGRRGAAATAARAFGPLVRVGNGAAARRSAATGGRPAAGSGHCRVRGGIRRDPAAATGGRTRVRRGCQRPNVTQQRRRPAQALKQARPGARRIAWPDTRGAGPSQHGTRPLPRGRRSRAVPRMAKRTYSPPAARRLLPGRPRARRLPSRRRLGKGAAAAAAGERQARASR